MRNTLVNRSAPYFLYLLLALPFQGCVPVATGVITYNAAVSHQESAAYADYVIETQERNDANKQAGHLVQVILSKREWLDQIQQPRFEYGEYYSWYTERGASSNSLVPFELWSESEREKFRSVKRAELRKKNPDGPPSQR